MEDNTRLIQYLDNELEAQERLALEKEIEANKEMKQELKRLQEMQSAIKLSGQRALRLELDGYMEDYKTRQTEENAEEQEYQIGDAGSFMGRQRKWVIITAIAASVLLLMIFNPFKRDPVPLNPQIDQAPIMADSATFEEKRKMEQDSIKEENDTENE